MRVVDLIKKKRDGGELSRDEIASLVSGYTRGEIPDYQVSAFLMAVFHRGMSRAETVALTQEMIHSGQVVDLSDIPGKKVDKHSTGGVGDKTSLVLAPLAAAAGVPVPMVSGRGLGHSGGTLDKLESIPGFRVNLPLDEYRQVLKKTGLVLIGQTAEIAPADKKLYALRDVTATVESIPLMAASIMSKKLAEGIDGLVLDVKTGGGAFMKTYDDARRLAETLVAIGQHTGKQVRALITDMDQPLGRAVGNSLEVIESIETLKGQGPPDLTELSVELAAHIVVLGERAESLEAARAIVTEQISNGHGLEKFRAVIEAQGGDPVVVDDYGKLPTAKHTFDLWAETDGYVARIDAETVGWASMWLGAGRERLDSPIDHAVGVVLHRKVGDVVHRSEPLCTIHYNALEKLEAVRQRLASAFTISDDPPSPKVLVKGII
jgi:pyrimidine-nucleoside phosphorylase